MHSVRRHARFAGSDLVCNINCARRTRPRMETGKRDPFFRISSSLIHTEIYHPEVTNEQQAQHARSMHVNAISCRNLGMMQARVPDDFRNDCERAAFKLTDQRKYEPQKYQAIEFFCIVDRNVRSVFPPTCIERRDYSECLRLKCSHCLLNVC